MCIRDRDTSFLNSAIYSVGSVALCTLFAAAAAYVLSRNRTKLNSFLYIFIVLGITMPIDVYKRQSLWPA